MIAAWVPTRRARRDATYSGRTRRRPGPKSGSPGGEASLCLPLPLARRDVSRPQPIARKVVYDFDLLSKVRGAGLAETPLDALTYVVFDTETTGLLPEKGDEIVQIAAVRIVNGRRVAGEVLDTLVNPGRAIPPVSTEVHGITDAMVAEAPDVAKCAASSTISPKAPCWLPITRRSTWHF